MPIQQTPAPKVAILLCTYNGARYLAEQLDSFESQTHAHWKAWASDDGSTDQTLSILQKYQEKWGTERLDILTGPRAGSTRNFMSLAYNQNIQADYYAFSDQDDIWEPDKLQRAVGWLENQTSTQPNLYGTRTRFVDEHNNEIGFSQLFKRSPSFSNALVQNIAGGNTMVFNSAARGCLGNASLDVAFHDWWVYIAVTACGGNVRYDPYPSLRYRQHTDNLLGMNRSWLARKARIGMLFEGHFRAWNDQNIAALRSISDTMLPQNQRLLERLAAARNKPLPLRLLALSKLGLYRQTGLGNLGLVTAAIFNKL